MLFLHPFRARFVGRCPTLLLIALSGLFEAFSSLTVYGLNPHFSNFINHRTKQAGRE